MELDGMMYLIVAYDYNSCAIITYNNAFYSVRLQATIFHLE